METCHFAGKVIPIPAFQQHKSFQKTVKIGGAITPNNGKQLSLIHVLAAVWMEMMVLSSDLKVEIWALCFGPSLSPWPTSEFCQKLQRGLPEDALPAAPKNTGVGKNMKNGAMQ